MRIEFCINELDSFLPEIAKQLGMAIKDDSFRIPASQGEGGFLQVKFSNELLLTYYDLRLNDNSIIIRKKGQNENIIPIIFWLSGKGIKQELDSEQKEIGKDTPNGAFLPSNSLETSYTFPKEIPIRNITVFVKKDWLRELVTGHGNFLDRTILSSANFFLYEEISFKMSEVLAEMENTLRNNLDSPLTTLSLYAKTLQLLLLLLEKIEKRPIEKQVVNINPTDVRVLFQVKAVVAQEYVSIPSTSMLAKECGMGERKLQRLFKQVFGKSIYQFGIEIKMAEAKKLLLSKKYSVSEVGYKVGYTNLSHFTEKFKEHFGITPKSFSTSH